MKKTLHVLAACPRAGGKVEPTSGVTTSRAG